MADYVVVMYAGRVVEKGTAEEIFANPAHPYTIGLMASKPVVGKKVDSCTPSPARCLTPSICRTTATSRIAVRCRWRSAAGGVSHMIQLSPTHMSAAIVT